MPVQGSMSIERMCQFAQVSRAGCYRSLQETTPVEEDMELRSAIQQIVLEHRRRYGYRRVSAELRRRGMLANHKRVARIMREDNLLCLLSLAGRQSHHGDRLANEFFAQRGRLRASVPCNNRDCLLTTRRNGVCRAIERRLWVDLSR